MMRFRCHALPLLALAATSAFASFEMVIVADADSRSFHRYDGVTGAYFGSFGTSGFTSFVRAMHADASSSRLYVASSSNLRVYDYSTGELLDTRFGGVFGASATYSGNGTFISVRGDDVIRETYFSGGSIDWALPGGVQARWVERAPDGRFVVGDSAGGGRLWRSDSTFVGAGWSLLGSAYVAPVASQAAWLDYSASNPGAPNLFYYHNFARVPRDSVYAALTGAYTITATGSWGLPLFDEMRGVAKGHRSMYVMGLDGSGQALLQNWTGDGYANQNYMLPQATSPVAMTVVVAPEPATLGALGLGALVLMRRRRAS